MLLLLLLLPPLLLLLPPLLLLLLLQFLQSRFTFPLGPLPGWRICLCRIYN
jgi:hypothetical protein